MPTALWRTSGEMPHCPPLARFDPAGVITRQIHSPFFTVLTIQCALSRVFDLTVDDFYADLGTSLDELKSPSPSRFILNSRGEETPTQRLGAACSFSGNISAIKVPSAAHPRGFCLDIFTDSLVVGERLSVLDTSGRIGALMDGVLPSPSRKSK
jgi:RES domain-containing protein